MCYKLLKTVKNGRRKRAAPKGNNSFIGSFAAISSALRNLPVRKASEYTLSAWVILVPNLSAWINKVTRLFTVLGNMFFLCHCPCSTGHPSDSCRQLGVPLVPKAEFPKPIFNFKQLDPVQLLLEFDFTSSP
jgi:hypothetical protein